MKRHCVLFVSVLLFSLGRQSSSFAAEVATFVRAVDGDTLEVNLQGRTESVRLIGVDTPRSGHDEATILALGTRAADFTKSLIRTGDQLRLQYDQDSRDKYQRLLAFVWLLNGRMLNETLLCEGYATALTRYPFRADYLERFRACERKAREQGKRETVVPRQALQR